MIKNQKKSHSFLSTVLAVFVAFTAIALVGTMFKVDDTPTVDKVELETSTVYFIPSKQWAEDNSSYGVWCWSDNSLPAARFVLATDVDENGVYELEIPTGYTSMLFVDLNQGATNLGLNWENKRDQTQDMTVPIDDNIYYHQYDNSWSNSSDLLYSPTTEEVNVAINIYTWDQYQSVYVYCFDKFNNTEPVIIPTAKISDYIYRATIPAGYTHIIFIQYNNYDISEGWENILHQTRDLLIPDNNNMEFMTFFDEWENTQDGSSD